MNTKSLIDKINDILPQTQCQLCDYPSCHDYATGIVNNETTINKCHPGGIPVLKKISSITKTPYQEYIKNVEKQHKAPSYVVIDEDTCIGCTKCIQACPVDAILGSAKQMHSIITSECSGCDLCIPVCPVDCILTVKRDYIPDRDLLKIRFDDKTKRTKKTMKKNNEKHSKNKLNDTDGNKGLTLDARKKAIAELLKRTKE